MTVTIKSKLICPYCNAKQEYKAMDYFPPYSVNGSVSENIQCDDCDEYFNAIMRVNEVETYTNLLLKP